MENLDPTLLAQIEKEGVGPFLRQMREKEDLTLRTISEQTRIRTYYLESIENGDFDKLPTGPVGLGFVRAFADAVGVDSNIVAASYKRETTGAASVDEFGVEPETRTLYSPVSRVNRFSSLATFAFVLIFLLAGGGLLWFMKGRTEQIVPVESIVGRIKTAVAPVAEKLPQFSGVSEKAKNDDGAGNESDLVVKKAPELESPPASTVNLKEPVAPPQEENPALQASAPAQENSAAEPAPPAQEAPRTQAEENPQTQAQAPSTVQARAQPQESPQAPQNPSAEKRAPAEKEVALNAAPERQAAPQEQQAPAAPAPAASRELPLTLKIYATEDTWLRIVVDSNNTEELLLLAGNEKDWKASEQFALTVGNVAGTQISLNGAEVALPKKVSNVLRDFVITKKSLN